MITAGVTPERAREIVANAEAWTARMAGPFGQGRDTPWSFAVQANAREHEIEALRALPQHSLVDALFALARSDWPDLVELDTGEIALVVIRRPSGSVAPHGVRRWSEKLGRLLVEEGCGPARFRKLPAIDDPRVEAIREWMRGNT